MSQQLVGVFLGACGLSLVAGLSAATEGERNKTSLPRYEATLLKPLPGSAVSEAVGINNLGVVVGGSGEFLQSSNRATVWDRRGGPTELPANGEFNEAVAINDAGEVVGNEVSPAGRTRACAWKAGVHRYLTEFPGALHSLAYDINNAGWVVGECGTGEFSLPPFEDTHAVLWRGEEMVDLGTLGGLSSYAAAINEKGQIVGTSLMGEGGERWSGFLWDKGVMTRLPTPDPYHSTEAHDINDGGFIVGTSADNNPFNSPLTLWQGKQVQALPFESHSPSVDNGGTVVSNVLGDADNYRAYVWTHGKRDSLAHRVSPRPKRVEWQNNEARDINSHGQVVGWKLRGRLTTSNSPIAFRLDPTSSQERRRKPF